MTADDATGQKSSLINRNVIIDGHRTSVRLEAEMWNDLRDICRREAKTMHEICTLVDGKRPSSRSLTSAIRVFLISYYRSAATEEGHTRAGHGQEYRIGTRIITPTSSISSVNKRSLERDADNRASNRVRAEETISNGVYKR